MGLREGNSLSQVFLDFAVREDVRNLLGLFCHLVVLDGPEGLVLLDVGFVLVAEGQVELVEELISDSLLLQFGLIGDQFSLHVHGVLLGILVQGPVIFL